MMYLFRAVDNRGDIFDIYLSDTRENRVLTEVEQGRVQKDAVIRYFLERRALIFFVPSYRVVAACWFWLILLALQIAIDDVVVDRSATPVLEDLHILADAGAQNQ